jgi:tetratricopeptide (TPR) repeat protein
MNEEQVAPKETISTAAIVTKRFGTGAKLLLTGVALIVVAFLAYPLLKGQFASTPTPLATVAAPQTPVRLTGPEATAQANPDSAQAQFELGNAYVDSAQWEQALVAYQRAVELDPNYQVAYANLGVVYYQLGQLELAASQYQKALELNPNDAEVGYNLGALYVQQALLSGNPPNPDLLNQAITQLKNAAKLNPKLAEPYFSLGVAYNALNQKEEAIQAFETFLTRDSGQDPRASQEARRYLETLRLQQ